MWFRSQCSNFIFHITHTSDIPLICLPTHSLSFYLSISTAVRHPGHRFKMGEIFFSGIARELSTHRWCFTCFHRDFCFYLLLYSFFLVRLFASFFPFYLFYFDLPFSHLIKLPFTGVRKRPMWFAKFLIGHFFVHTTAHKAQCPKATKYRRLLTEGLKSRGENYILWIYVRFITVDASLEEFKIFVIEKLPLGNLVQKVIVLSKKLSLWNIFFTNGIEREWELVNPVYFAPPVLAVKVWTGWTK